MKIIPRKKWDKLHDLACDAVNDSACGRDSSKNRGRVVRYLKKLIGSYGRLADLLDVLASYERDENKALIILKEAYCNACETSDIKNKTMISASLAEIYVRRKHENKVCQFWLKQLGRNLNRYHDDYFNQLYKKLSEEYLAR